MTAEKIVEGGATALPLPRIRLAGEDGNAFAILGRWRFAARRAGWPPEAVQRVLAEAMSGDYDHLLATILDNCEPDEEADE